MRTVNIKNVTHTYYTIEEFAKIVDHPKDVLAWCMAKMAYETDIEKGKKPKKEDYIWPELSARDMTFVSVALAMEYYGEILVKQWEVDNYYELREYNGMTNMPTWIVSLWLDNEERSYNYIRNVARETIEDNNIDIDSSIYYFSNFLEQLHEDEIVEALQSGYTSSVFSDLLFFSLSYVNWREISESIINEELEKI